MSPIEITLLVLLASASAASLFIMQRQQQKSAHAWDMEKSQLVESNNALQSKLTVQLQELNHVKMEQALAVASQKNSQHSLQEKQQQLDKAQHTLELHRSLLRQVEGDLKQNQATLDERKEDKPKLEAQAKHITQLNGQVSDLNSALKQEQLAREKDQQNLEEKLQLLTENKVQLKQEFENLSNKIFEDKHKQFKQTSQEGLSSLLNPFKDQLEGLRKKVDDVYVSESKDRAALRVQIGDLHNLNKQITQEAASLTRALRGEKKTQGNWGELVLETVLEKSGLREGEEFVREKSITNEDGERLRPDVIINLPENKHIVVDAKVSLNAYTDYINAESENDRVRFLKSHINAVRLHIKSLADKSYSKLPGINSPDFVFMFMPIEPAFMVAFEHDDKLFNDAFEQRIVVVTPTTLLASLRTVSSLWSIERQNKNAKQLAEQAAKVHDKLVGFVESMEKVGIQLITVQGTYDKAWSQLKEGRGNLISQAHKFKDLGVRMKKDMPKQVLEAAELEFSDDKPQDDTELESVQQSQAKPEVLTQ
jgi:DNA recombination protein RmuC